MSKFWGGSSSEEESTDNESQESSEEEQPQKRSNFFLDSDSDDDGATKRVVKSKRDKQWDELKASVTKLKNFLKKAEWASVQTEFDLLNKLVTKSKNLIQKEGLPNFYVGTLVLLEDKLEEVDKEQLKALSKNNAKGYNSMRQKLRKHNKEYEAKIAAYRKNPPADEDEEGEGEEEEQPEEESEESSEEKLPVKATSKPSGGASKWFTKSGGDDESTSEDDNDDDDDSIQDSEEEVKSRWFVKDKDEGEKKDVAGTKRERTAKSATGKSEGKLDKKDSAKPEEKIEWTIERVSKRLSEIVMLRGRRNTDQQAQITALNELLVVSKSNETFGKAVVVAVTVQLLAAHFDLVQTHIAAPIPLWQTALALLLQILEITITHNVRLNSLVAISFDFNEEEPSKSVVAGNILAFLERLDDELTKIFQSLDAQSPDYPARLIDEESLIGLIQRIQGYYNQLGDEASTVRCAQRLLEHLYYKNLETNPERAKLVTELANNVFEKGDERLKSRAMLCLIFHHALHDRFHEARDLMLMSHLQDTIHQTQDISTQILFNRTMTQLGLCAFRLGLITEAHACLMDVSGKIKELLAQGMSNQRYQDRTVEQEKLERQRLVPAHMHINADLIEASHLISAMLLEVPNRASGLPSDKKRVISRLYRRLTEYAERLIFAGPPETVRDVVVAAGMSLAKGDWQQSSQLLFGLKVWATLVPATRDSLVERLKLKLQETALKTYVLTYGHVYESISLDQLGVMFALPASSVHSQISRLIIAEELNATIDHLSNTLMMQRTEPSRLQLVALQYAEKAALFVESNERLLDSRSGGSHGYKSFDKPNDPNQNRRGQQQRPRNNNPNQQRRPAQQRT